MLSELAEGIPGIGLSSQLKGPENGKKGLFKEEDPFLVEKATLPTGVFAVHVFGCENIFLDQAFPSEHFGMYVRITAGSVTKCTSLQSPLKKGRVVWNEVRNFPITISSKVANPVNKVIVAVLGVDKLQTILKPKLLGKTEFHLHKLAKKQWSMESFELQNRKKQYAGDVQLELAFAYGFCGYGLCDQIESHHPPRYYLQQSTFPHLELLTSLSGNSSGIVFAPKRVSHPAMIPFKHKVTTLEPDFSPYYSRANFVRTDTKSRPQLQEKMTRLNQLHTDYFQLTTRTKRIDFLKKLLQEKDLQGSLPGDQNSDSDSSSAEDLGQVTQFGLTGVLAQMANLTFMAGAPDLIQFAQRDGHSGSSAPGPNQLTEENRGMDKVVGGRSLNDTLNVAGVSGLALQTRSGFDGSVSSATDNGGETQLRKVEVVEGSDNDAIEDTEQDEHDIMAGAATRGRRSAIVARSPGQKKAKQATGEKVTNL